MLLLLLLPLPPPLLGPDRERGRREGSELVKLLSIPNYVVLRHGYGEPVAAAGATPAATTVQTILGLD